MKRMWPKPRNLNFHRIPAARMENRGHKNSGICKRANVDKKLFSKIMNNVDYHPARQTALAFDIALQLNLTQTPELIVRAGFPLSHSSKFDIIAEYCIVNRITSFTISTQSFSIRSVPAGRII